ncbi:MAG: carboxylating nicotinate-nucleotide diphosphorylase [Candidatus Omnitrophica bacterium]|nr:carboxylating nicotinate-nucleotide diphosphorylase [Candidatus Omnitrophota bacterium]
MQLDRARVLRIIKAALKEDIGRGDITTQPLIDRLSISKAVIISREDCVVCGLEIAEMVMAGIDYSVRFKPNCKDGTFVGKGKDVAFIEGATASILRAERTMLNFLTFLSGISTRTRQYQDKVKPYDVKIMDTRKTIPLLRYLEKYAVFTGGGANHRMGLYDQVLIKDNHIYCRKNNLSPGREFSLKSIVEEARKKSRKGTVVEIEISTLKEFSDALGGRPDIIMLDNMGINEIKACVEIRKLSKTKPLLEVSGGITLDTVEEYAKTGVEMISIGELTDSVRAIDMSLDLI